MLKKTRHAVKHPEWSSQAEKEFINEDLIHRKDSPMPG
jgi:hypothetical protein